MLQLITSDEMTTINLNVATVIHNDDKAIKVLINADSLSESQREILDHQAGLFFSFNDHQNCIKTKDHYIKTSVKDGGGCTALETSQWLVEFEL